MTVGYSIVPERRRVHVVLGGKYFFCVAESEDHCPSIPTVEPGGQWQIDFHFGTLKQAALHDRLTPGGAFQVCMAPEAQGFDRRF